MSAFQRFSSSVCCFLLFAGCSPSLDEAKQVLQQQITSQSQGHIKLVSFRKTALQEIQVQGVLGRRIIYAAEVEFDQRGLWSRGVGNKSLGFEFSPNLIPATGDIAGMMKDLQGERQMCEGERVRIAGMMTGTKPESGWKYELNENRISN